MIDFSFKVTCDSDFKPHHECPDDPSPQPEINYLAKDFAELPPVNINRIERDSPGKGATQIWASSLSSFWPYVGDYLSYQQDVRRPKLPRHGSPPRLHSPSRAV